MDVAVPVVLVASLALGRGISDTQKFGPTILLAKTMTLDKSALDGGATCRPSAAQLCKS